MSQKLSISETGLKLIKAFEGYRPVDRELVTGARVIGYGHRLLTDMPRTMSQSEAEAQLRRDLEPYEELVNEEVHAPLTQSQFDALCSLAFNIGPKAFRGSDALRALNNGRPLDAANGFDVWRKSTINGKTYVVDALVRRRTAEKSLFLRTERSLTAPSALLPPVEDEVIALVPTDDGMPVFTQDEAETIVRQAPYDAREDDMPRRRREDGPAGILTLSEVIEDNDDFADEDLVDIDAQEITPEPEELVEVELEPDSEAEDEPKLSVISQAADDLGDRLDALIDQSDTEDDLPTEDWPQSLIRPVSRETKPETKETASNLVAFPGPTRKSNTLDEFVARPTPISEQPATPVRDILVIDNLAQDEAIRKRREPSDDDVPTDWLGEESDQYKGLEKEQASSLWIPVLLGSTLLGASVAAAWLGPEQLMGDWGPVIVTAGLITGGLMAIYALYSMAVEG